MEEDIKILENIIVEYNTQVEDYKYFSVPVRLDERDIEALENLLTRYKDIKRINSDLQGEQEQLYNKIDKLEEKNEEWQRAYQEEKDKQFELLRENKELREEECCMTTCLRKDKERVFFENKVIEKIEELEPKIKEFSQNIEDSTGTEKIFWKRQRAELVGARNALQELLREE